MRTQMIAFCIISILLNGIVEAQEFPSIQQLIQKAGNAEQEENRLRVLRQLYDHPNVSLDMQEEVDHLIHEIERWNTNPRLDFFGSEVRRDLDWDFDIGAQSTLYPLTHLYRARMLIWCALEYGNIWRSDTQREKFLGKARKELEMAHSHFPNNTIITMYLGEPIQSTDSYITPSNAPAWAVAQREGLERLADIIEWWIDHREQDNHEYGGGWGDDCEMWRWWVPVLIGFQDPKIEAAQSRFSNALLNQPHLQKGYMARMTDVEHSAEDTSDALTPMMHLDPDNPQWKKRVLQLVELAESLWMGRNQKGHLQFKSTFFSATEVDLEPERACDTVYHPRTLQPVLLYWQRTGDARIGRLISEWMNTWVEATASSERGKPAGIIPSAIHWPGGMVGGLHEPWWDPRNTHEPTLYRWPSAMDLMTNTLLLTYHMTGDSTFFNPIRSMAALRKESLQPQSHALEPGSLAWCAHQIDVNPVLAKYKFLTGSDEFDSFLEEEQTPYMLYCMGESSDVLVKALQNNAKALSVNFPGYTSEVRYTDRVLRFPQLSNTVLMNRTTTRLKNPDPDLLYSTVTGDPGSALYFPINRVRWLTPPRDIAALVRNSSFDQFEAQLFHFGKQDREMVAELYLLEEGEFEMELLKNGEAMNRQTIQVNDQRTVISFSLPSAVECRLVVKKMKNE